MDIKPIKTERDYQRALKLIESVMDAKANTPRGDRLDVLATLVAAWEDTHHAIEPPMRWRRSGLLWSNAVWLAETSSHTLAAVPGSPRC